MRHSLRLLLAISCVASLFTTTAFAKKPPKQIKSSRPSTKVPKSVSAKLDVVYAAYGKRKMHMDIFTPKFGKAPYPAVAVIHGGGWLNGDKSKFRALAIALAAKGYVAAAIEYRLGGEALFPAGIQDCNTAVRYLRANAKKLQLDPKRIGAVGGSAGGHIVGLMATAPHVSDFQGTGGNADTSSQLQLAIVMAGPLELATGPVAEKSRKMPGKSNANKWFGKTIDQAPELYRNASPITHVSKKSPPILFMVGEHDKPSRNAATRKKLKNFGIKTGIKVYANGKHGCWNREPWFSPMVADMDTFFRTTLLTGKK
jgi:gluconolactonase